MLKRHLLYVCTTMAALLVLATVVQAVPIHVPNGDFEDWQAIGEESGWSSGEPGVGGANVGSNDEFWSNPNSFGSGWQDNGKSNTTSGKFGLQHPADAQHSKEGDQTLSAPANGNFIGFANLTEGDGTGESTSSVQSGILGQLQEGIYTLNVAVGARQNANWEPIEYTISLVAGGLVAGDPLDNEFGTSGGTILGSESVTLDFEDDPPTPEWFDLEFVLDTTGHASLGDDFAIRIDSANAGDNMSFTQANFDNARLEFVPEPGSIILASCGAALAIGMVRRRRRRK